MSTEAARPDPRDLPAQRRGTTPQMIGRYPDYDVLSEAGQSTIAKWGLRRAR